MAILTPQNYSEIRDAIYRAGVGKEELKALPALPNKARLLAGFQSVEDFMVANFPTMKANLDAALGVTTTPALARKIIAGYLRWKINNLLGV